MTNDEAYTNRIVPIWNGTYVTPVTLNPDGSVGFASAQKFDGVSNGMQFPPYMDNSNIQVFDSRTVQVNTYKENTYNGDVVTGGVGPDEIMTT